MRRSFGWALKIPWVGQHGCNFVMVVLWFLSGFLAFAELDRNVIPEIQLSSLPTYPLVEVLDSNPKIWQVHDDRSELLSIMQCWYSSVEVPILLTMEEIIQAKFYEERFFFLDLGVNVRAIVDTQRVCLLWSGLETALIQAIPTGNQLLKEVQWTSKKWQNAVENWEGAFTGTFSQAWLHRTAQDILLHGQVVLEWDWRYRQLNRRWHQFLHQSESKVVIVGVMNNITRSAFELHSDFNWLFKNRQLTMPNEVSPAFLHQQSSKRCFQIQSFGFSQSTMSFHVKFQDTNADEAKYIAQVLGGGVRSRLSQVLREETGLVYNIGAKAVGREIIIEYTINNSDIVQSQILIEEIISDLRRQWVTQREWAMAKGALQQVQYQILEDYNAMARYVMAYSEPGDWSVQQQNRLTYPWENFQRPFEVQEAIWLIVGDMDIEECQKVVINEMLEPIYWDNF